MFGPRSGATSVLALLSAFLIAAMACAPAPAPAATPAATPVAAATPAPTPKPPPDKLILITDFAAFGYTSPFYGGVEQGFFRDENIDLTITLGQGSGDTVAKVGAGAAQLGLADTITAVVGIGKGTPIKLIATHWQSHPGGVAYIAERREIKSYKDFEGLKFGAAAGDAYLVILPELMRQAGADPTKYDVVTMAAAATTAALISGQIDLTTVGAATFSSRALGVKQQGFTLKLFRFAENGLDALGHSIIVNGDLLGRNKDLVQRFVRAYAKSMVWGRLNVDKAVDAYMKVNAQQNREGEKANYLATIPFELDTKASGPAGLFVFPKEKTEKTVVLANKAYSLTVNPSAIYTSEFILALPEALRRGQLP